MPVRRELLKPKIDIVFRSLFREGNEDITKAIISAITKEKIKEINLNNDKNIIGKYVEEKMGILDLRATLDDGVICNIEIQLADNKDTAERFLYYWSRLYSSQLVKGDDYAKLNKVIGIIILDYKYEKTKELERMHTKWKIKETLSGKEIELTDVLELHIIEIPKARDILRKDENNEIAQWMMFLDNPNEKEVLKIMEENGEIKKAMDELEELSSDYELRRIAELKEKGIRDEKNGLRHAREDGREEIIKSMITNGVDINIIKETSGLEEKELNKIIDNLGGIEKVEELRRIAELKEKGIRDEKNGLGHAREEGRKERTTEIVKEMLDKGLNIGLISEITKLSKKEIEKIKLDGKL